MDLPESGGGVLNVCSALMLAEGRSRESTQCVPNFFRLTTPVSDYLRRSDAADSPRRCPFP